MSSWTIFFNLSMILISFAFFVFLLVIWINKKPLGLFHIFNKKRRTIISDIIEYIKDEPDEWEGIGSDTKRFKNRRIRVRNSLFDEEAFIGNNNSEFSISFLECVRLSRHFKKLERYQKLKKKRQKRLQELETIDKVLLTTSGMEDI